MKKQYISRRQFLYGSGGAAVGLPFLPSLLPGPAWGAEPVAPSQKCFAAFTSVHGACLDNAMIPSEALLNKSAEIHPGHTVKYGTLVGTPEGTGLRLSNAIRAANLTPALLAKMNVLRSCFDFPYYSGHHSGQLGNYASSDENPVQVAGQSGSMTPWPSIDQVMAWSPSFYGDASGVTLRSIVTGRAAFHSSCSFMWSNPQAKNGSVQGVGVESSSVALFNKLFQGGIPKTTTPNTPTRPSIIDRVMANYTSLRQSNRRLSKEDKQRLDDHVARLTELQRTMKAVPRRTCSNVTKPGDDSGKYQSRGTSGQQYFPLVNDVIAAAFSCGVSRIATIAIPGESFYEGGGDYHLDVAHNAGTAGNQGIIVSVHQQIFQYAFVDLMKKLDAIQSSPGRTLLDDSLVQWTSEAGSNTHTSRNNTMVAAGSAGGFFKTGNYVNFQGTKKMKLFGSFDPFNLGLLQRQWLATALQAMGVLPSEWERNGKPGYGDPFQDQGYTKFQIPEVFDNSSKPVPIIT